MTTKINKIKSIWIESEEYGANLNGNSMDDNSDVVVAFEDGNTYIATFFTYDNIQTLRRRYSQTGECLSGQYFWASDMVLIDQISRESIQQVINHLLETGEFSQIFKAQ
jgi:hypothetical protein